MDKWNEVVLPEGALNDNYIWSREVLYIGMNGRKVERFHVTPTESYIFKPLTNNSQWRREVWVYEHILPALPPIYPKMLAHSDDSAEPVSSWAIFEDLGTLNHVYSREQVLEVTTLMAIWHALPLDTWYSVDIPLTGPKPLLDQMIVDVLTRVGDLERSLSELHISKSQIQSVCLAMQNNKLIDEIVLSHGDLHLGNYADTYGQMTVLDWEHVHLNVPYWDLYHLIDMAHPLFPISERVTPSFRERVLDKYLEQSALLGRKLDSERFVREYHLFSSLFSLWMILLIEDDLSNSSGPWTIEQLEVQRIEIRDRLIQCLNYVTDLDRQQS